MSKRKIGQPLIPKSILCLRDYSVSKFSSDLIAGITVGLVALPLAMAFAISSGMQPLAGIYTAIVAGTLISVLGGSRCQIGGPTGAFVVVVSGIIATHGVDGLFMCTFMAGILLVLLGLSGLGSAVGYIPRPVVIGFTNGIAVLIASTQIKDFFGLSIDKVPGDFTGRIAKIVEHFGTISPQTTALATVSLLIVIAARRYTPRVPGSIIALVAGTIAATVLHLQVATIHSQFGDIPRGLPSITLPSFRFDLIVALLSPTITVAMLGAIESLLSAVVADKMSGDRHNPNMELVAQGVANICSPLVGGLPATGAIARTATNIRSGAKTPFSGIIHGITLLIILLAAAPLAGMIPLAVLSAILFVVAYNMGEWHEIPEILRLSRSSRVVWLVTFGLTVFADLTVAVEAGMAMAALLYIKQVTDTTSIIEITPSHVETHEEHSVVSNPLPDGVTMFRIHGPFLFGSSDKLSVISDRIAELPRVIILRLRDMNALDATGVSAIEGLAEELKSSGRTMIICGMRDQPARILRRAEFDEIVGGENICDSLRAAVTRAKEILAAS